MKINVIYRMCDVSSSNCPPIYSDNKFRLNEICLRSFVEAFREVNPHVSMICDRCPEFYESFVKRIVPFDMTVEFTQSGVKENAVHQYDYVEDDDYYLFQECDYLYLPNTGKSMIEACNKYDFITPYDHPDKYQPDLMPKNLLVDCINGQHWRTTDSTTSTFMARGDIVRKELDLFKSWGWEDHKRWLDFGNRGYKLWSPIPSIATHMVEDYMAPKINWKLIWEEYI